MELYKIFSGSSTALQIIKADKFLKKMMIGIGLRIAVKCGRYIFKVHFHVESKK